MNTLDIHVDVETLALKNTDRSSPYFDTVEVRAVVTHLAIVPVLNGEVLDIASMHFRFDTQQQINWGRVVDPDTVAWRDSLPEETKLALATEGELCSLEIALDALMSIPHTLIGCYGLNETRVQYWSRGSFDFPILASLVTDVRLHSYEAIPLWSYAVKYWQECEFRTLINEFKFLFSEQELKPSVGGHTALVDARHCAAMHTRIIEFLKASRRIYEMAQSLKEFPI